MAEETKVQDLLNGKIEISPGMVLEDRLRLGTVLYLERKFEKSLTDILQGLTGETVNFTQLSVVLTGLYMQTNPELTEAQAEQAVARLDLEQVASSFAKLRFAEFAPKNVQPPAAQTQA